MINLSLTSLTDLQSKGNASSFSTTFLALQKVLYLGSEEFHALLELRKSGEKRKLPNLGMSKSAA